MPTTVRNGVKDSDEVRDVQRMLNKVQGAGLKTDGDFGPKTEAAVRRFQQANGLGVDGIVGPNTWDALTRKFQKASGLKDDGIIGPKTRAALGGGGGSAPTGGGHPSSGGGSAAELLSDPRVLALLDTIAYAEGTDKSVDGVSKGYDVIVGYAGHVTDFSRHPNKYVPAANSTAAGRYQFLASTWGELGQPDFTPHSQDVGGVKLLQRRHMIAPLQADNVRQAILNGNREWASLPGSPYGQHTYAMDTLLGIYNKSLGLRRGKSASTPPGSPPPPPPAAATPAVTNGKAQSILHTLATTRLNDGPTGYCVATTMANLDRLGIAAYSGGTAGDPNNPRGGLVKIIQGGHWASLALPGAQARTITSPYGSVRAYVLDGATYSRMAHAGQLPSGAIVFQTRHGWGYSGGSSGNDMAIIRDGGRHVHNYATMGGVVYSDLKEAVVVVPTGH